MAIKLAALLEAVSIEGTFAMGWLVSASRYCWGGCSLDGLPCTRCYVTASIGAACAAARATTRAAPSMWITRLPTALP